MRPESLSAIESRLQPFPRFNAWQWAESSIDYSRVRNYDTEWKGPYKADYMPYWKGPIEWATASEVREIWALKCSRSGFDENMGLTVLRYTVACQPMPVMYIAGQCESIEKFMEERIKPGFGFAIDTAARYKDARVRGLEVHFDSMSLVGSYPGNKMAFKQSGYALILASEVSMWPGFASDMLRERTTNYSFPHIIGGSSPDPAQKRASSEDPIFLEYAQTDQCRWECKDPVTGNRFVFRLGNRDSVDGVKWESSARDENGNWDISRVIKSAHYVTPDGTRINESERIAVVSTGQWTPSPEKDRMVFDVNGQKIGTKPIPGRRGCHITRFMVPFTTGGSFGHIAAKFIEANSKGPQALRTFIYEYLAEPYYADKTIVADDAIENKKAAYKKGAQITTNPQYGEIYIPKKSMVFVTVDVQKKDRADAMYWLARQWFDGGDSALIDYGSCDKWDAIKALSAKYNARKMFIDNSYPDRMDEIKQQVTEGVMRGAVMCYGRDNIKTNSFRSMEPFSISQNIDPFEGTSKQGRFRVATVTHHPNTIKTMLWQLVSGLAHKQWHIPDNIDPMYCRHMKSEQCIDGAWEAVHRDNHWFDCEVLQLVAAKIFGLYKDFDYGEIIGRDAEKAEQQPQVQTRATPAKVESDPRATYSNREYDDDDDQQW